MGPGPSGPHPTMAYPVPDLPLIASEPAEISAGNAVVFEESIRRSRFITCVFHADSREGVLGFVEAARKAYPNATHYCWAYAAGAPGDTARIGQSDDGEPHGTAGRPMLTQLLHCGMGEVAAVTVRYFGGVKLGTGGLARAYQNGVAQALTAVPSREKKNFVRAVLTVDYALLRRVQADLARCGGLAAEQNFGESAELVVDIPEDACGDFAELFKNATGGKGTVVFG